MPATTPITTHNYGARKNDESSATAIDTASAKVHTLEHVENAKAAAQALAWLQDAPPCVFSSDIALPFPESVPLRVNGQIIRLGVSTLKVHRSPYVPAKAVVRHGGKDWDVSYGWFH